jgi:hypothetical protein
MNENEIKDLGCMNGWKDPSNEWTLYWACLNAGHRSHLQNNKLGNCWTEITCEICKIKYNVDSSD